jgi:hypothetical protein
MGNPFTWWYGKEYYLERPGLFIHDLCLNIKYAYQRVVRGWDDTAVWSVDSWLCRVLPEMLRKLKEDKKGLPIEAFSEPHKHPHSDKDTKEAEARWNKILDDIIEGFEAGNNIIEQKYPCWDEYWEAEEAWRALRNVPDEDYWTGPEKSGLWDKMNMKKKIKEASQEEYHKFHKGMILFHKWFFNLWD